MQETETRRKAKTYAHKPTNTYYVNTRQGRNPNTPAEELHTTTTPK
jgi:hypothetical protein